MDTPQEKCDAVIVAAGSGTRLGFSVPKAFIQLCGRPLLTWSLDVFRKHASIASIVLVVPENLLEEAETAWSGDGVLVVAGGPERWMSVRNGASACRSEWLLVHDAARPFVTGEIIDSLLALRGTYSCAITATPVVDTIRTFDGDRAGDTVDRSKLVRVGTPQLFRRDTLEKGFAFAPTCADPPTDEAMLMQALDIPVGIAWGNPDNFKITTREDLKVAEALCAHRQHM